MRKIDFEMPCAHCGTSLKGLLLLESCRGCERPIGHTIDLRTLGSADLTIRHDRPCARCGYNLHSLGMAAVCPECAEPVIHSLRPRELWAANRNWLLRVREGVKMLVVSGIGILAVFVAIAFLDHVPPGTLGLECLVFSGFILLALALLTIVGVVHITSREVTHPSLGESHWPNTLARATILLSIVSFAGRMGVFQILAMAGGGILPVTMMIDQGCSLSALSICPVLTAVCLRRLARRGTGGSLVSATTVWIRIAACLVLLLVAKSSLLPLFLTSWGVSPTELLVFPLAVLLLAWWPVALLLCASAVVGLVAYKRLLDDVIAQLPSPATVPTPRESHVTSSAAGAEDTLPADRR